MKLFTGNAIKWKLSLQEQSWAVKLVADMDYNVYYGITGG